MARPAIAALAGAVAALLSPAPAAATTYRIAPGGRDRAPGTSPARAWATLARAGRARLRPGDKLLLRSGGTWSGGLDVRADGAPGRPIVIGAYGSGRRPTITGACVRVGGARVVVRGLHLDRCDFAGVTVDGDRDRVEGNLVTRNVAGVYVREGATGAVVAGNTLRDNDRMSVNTPAPADDDSGAFGILLRGDRTTVSRNVISGSDAFSYDYGRDGSAVEVFGGRGNVVERNLAVDDNAFSELGNPRTADTTFAYNVVRSRLAASTFLIVRGAADPRGPTAATRVLNTTVLLTGERSQGVVCFGGCGPTILAMRNNIVDAAGKAGFADAPFDEDHDLFFGGRAQLPLGPHSRFADPRFVSPGAGDVRLRRSSPAVRAGVDVGYRRDFEGARVPARPDLGAYQLTRSP